MKKFEDYVDGEQVYYKNHATGLYGLFKAYKSQYTHNAFRLKNHTGEVIADISEITPEGDSNEKSNSNIQSGSSSARYDSDADSSGIYSKAEEFQD